MPRLEKDTYYDIVTFYIFLLLHCRYHHVTVLLYSVPVADYLSRSTHTNVGTWFAGVNFAVHSIMYSYYTLRVLGKF